MENQNENAFKDFEKSQRRGKIMGGLLILGIGLLFLARELGVQMPFWLFSWKMLLIGLGVVLAVKHKFMHRGWIVLMVIGGAFLMNDFYPELNIKPLLWPSALILVGLFIIFKPRRKRHHMHAHWKKWQRHQDWNAHHKDMTCYGESDKEDSLESICIMGGVKKNIFSKKFKGGEIVNIFGGTEINLMQADLEEKATLEVTQVLGGTKLLVPANWGIKSELVTVFGSVEDARPVQPNVGEETKKLLVLTGTTVFGGIEIKSY